MACEPFHDRQREAQVLLRQQVDGARAAEDQLQRHRAHEGRHDQRQHPERLDQQRPAKAETHREVGQRHRNQRGPDGGHHGHVQAVEEGLAHERDACEGAEVAQREAAVGVDEGGVEHARHGQHEEEQQEGQDERSGQPGTGAHAHAPAPARAGLPLQARCGSGVGRAHRSSAPACSASARALA
jgi:hypothetical protein